ncbi:3-deoxy-D-manno-octulosonic acid transferase [Botrimarina hoheduenensis]|uniref:3-deoxy-D-manno-octulosonic acid transferase n=1 Tax=Botrimarina hoheduenensis TaxID=2528000 RepID=A0A5C5VZN2_9BACT|nr:3-deoxy-D-manno-octulosonic acid transferase [Botrimarina hoheduenensis]TWT43251.1 3-deoxy-D-manno-octulosonic acid transferase [Botrimarina hoheduenensis]
MPRPLGWLLNAVYACALILAMPWIAWQAWQTGKYRDGWPEKLRGQVPRREGQRLCVWLHAVSVGEVNLIGVLIAELKQRRPEWELCVSTTTKTGYDLAIKKYGTDQTVFYCPLDFTWAVEEAMRRVRPDLLLLAELELWPNLIAAAQRQGARVAIFNGRLSESSFKGYRRLRPLSRHVLALVDKIAAQDEATAERFRELGAERERVVVTGSLKYDGAQTERNNPRTQALHALTGWGASETVWLLGSTQAPEEGLALSIFSGLLQEHPQLRLVIVPRHPERFDEVAALLRRCGLAWCRRSALGGTDASQTTGKPPAVILVDTIGELSAWWGLADIGFVGGSFGDRGGQNMIEPAGYGVATCFGPNTRNFRDIVQTLLAADGARVVADVDQLEAFVAGCLKLPAAAAELGQRGRGVVLSQLGATRRTGDLVETLVRAGDHPTGKQRTSRAA